MSRMGERGKMMCDFFNILNEIIMSMVSLIMWSVSCPMLIFFFLIVHEFVCLPLQANTMNASVFAHAATGYIALTFSKYHIWGQRQWLIMLTLRKMQKKGEKKDQVSWEEKNRVCLRVCEGHWQLERERERERFSWDILKYVVCRVVASQSLEQCY